MYLCLLCVHVLADASIVLAFHIHLQIFLAILRARMFSCWRIFPFPIVLIQLAQNWESNDFLSHLLIISWLKTEFESVESGVVAARLRRGNAAGPNVPSQAEPGPLQRWWQCGWTEPKISMVTPWPAVASPRALTWPHRRWGRDGGVGRWVVAGGNHVMGNKRNNVHQKDENEGHTAKIDKKKSTNWAIGGPKQLLLRFCYT